MKAEKRGECNAGEGNSSEDARAVRRVEAMVARVLDGEATGRLAEPLERVPHWRAGLLPMPTAWIAGGIFSQAQPQAGEVYVHRRELACADGYEVTYSGKLLHQGHADMLMTLLWLSGSTGVGLGPIEMSLGQLAGELGHGRGRENQAAIYGMLRDLTEGFVDLRVGNRGWMGTLIERVEWEREVEGLERYLRIHHCSGVLELLAHGVVKLDAEQRSALARKPLAKWLHTYSTWATPQLRGEGLALERMRQISRASVPPRRFRQGVRAALGELDAVGAGRYELAGDDRVRLLAA